MSNDIAIRVDGLWKRYGLPIMPNLRRAVRRLKGEADDPLKDGPWALHDLNFEVKRGETLGIIGRNGAGKSTLLKVLAGVTPPTHGKVDIRGRIFPMIELNAGLNPELTGRENVRLLAAVMGLTRKETDAIMPDVEEFCELNEWFDRSVRKYSSGMLARLGFAVAMNVEADVLLIDEVLAVGDITFQRKSLERMERLQQSGKTLLFVSHSLKQVERLCDKALLLDTGKMIVMGRTVDVVSDYYKDSNARILEHYNHQLNQSARTFENKMENATVDVNVRLLDVNGQPSTTFHTGESLTIEVEYDAHEEIDDPIIGFSVNTLESFYISGFTNENLGNKIQLSGKGYFLCVISSLPLLSGIYTISLKIKHQTGAILGGGSSLAIFSVIVPGDARLASDYGVVMMSTRWETPTPIQALEHEIL